MKAFQKFNPASPVSEFPETEAAKAPKAAKPQEFRHFRPAKAHLKPAKAGGALGSFSHTLAGGKPQKTSALAALGALAGGRPEKSRVTRAVLLQLPDGVPELWGQGIANLLVALPRSDWPEARWKVLQEDALAFMRGWASQAHALGWPAMDIFGVHADASLVRLDGMGLVPLLDGRPVAALSEDGAAITASSGGTLTYRRKEIWPPGCCLVWELEGHS